MVNNSNKGREDASWTQRDDNSDSGNNGIEVEKVAGIAGLEVWAPVNQDMDMILYFTKDCKVIKTLDISLDDETSEFIFADIV